MKTFSERLNAAMESAGYSQERLGEAVELTQPAIQKMTSGKTKGSKKTIAIAKVLGVRPEWLASGDGPMRSDGQPEPISTEDEPESFRVEVLDVHASAGPGVINSEVIQTIKSIEYTDEHALLMFGGKLASNIKMITVEGDSMSGTIEIGDSIFVDITKDYFSTDGIYVFLFKNRLHVKRLQMMPDHLLVHSDNPQYADWKISEENEQHLKVMGRVLLSQSQAFKRHG